LANGERQVVNHDLIGEGLDYMANFNSKHSSSSFLIRILAYCR
jgi:hypothetical protein